MTDIALQIKNLSVSYGPLDAVQSLNLTVKSGEVLGVIGESGSGKSTLIWALTRLLPSAGRIHSGRVLFQNQDLLQLTLGQLQMLRGNRISYISQDPLRALNPLLTVGQQMMDIQLRDKITTKFRHERVIEMLNRVQLPDPSQRLKMYPHQLSGGQRQRVSIAMALLMKPDLLLADEPTTALDATLEVKILGLLKTLQKEVGCTMIFVTHHLGVVASLCNEVAVMHDGLLVETGPVAQVLSEPKADYTRRLIRCDPARILETTRRLPTMADDPDSPIVIDPRYRARIGRNENTVLEVNDLYVSFSGKSFFGSLFGSHKIQALDGVSLSIGHGETLALVGESGSGKTTLARAIMGLAVVDSGQIKYAEKLVSNLSRAEFKPLRREISMMFQDPTGSLSPRMKIGTQVVEPMVVHGLAPSSLYKEACRLLAMVGLGPQYFDRYPHELSGGQARRVGVARALSLSPKLIIADEPTAGLDVSIQGEMLNLLADIQQQTGVSILIITHNLAVVRHLADFVVVLRNGVQVEAADAKQIFADPVHEYTKALIDASQHELPTSG